MADALKHTVDTTNVTDNRKSRNKRKQKLSHVNNSVVDDNFLDFDFLDKDFLDNDFNHILTEQVSQNSTNDKSISLEENSVGGLIAGNGTSSSMSEVGLADANEGVTQNNFKPEADRLTGNFVSDNVINLSRRVLSHAEISVLSKGLKFCPTPRELDKAKIKQDLENFGRRLRLKWHFRHEEEEFSTNPFKHKSTYHPKNEDAAIEVYLSTIEEQILGIHEQGSNYSNLTVDEREALRTLRNDSEIIIKSADKGSGVVVWDKEDYLKEADSQLSDASIYEEIDYDPSSALEEMISECVNSIRDRGDIMDPDTLQFFSVDNPKLGRFYLLPKIHKRLCRVPGRPVISNSGYYTENISAFLDFHLQPLSQKVKSYIKDTNDFLRKIRDLPDLPADSIFCTIDVVGLYPNIPHEDGLEAIRKSLDSREDPEVSTATLMELANLVLKNNYFVHNGKTYKQKQGTAIGTKFAPSYAILAMGDFETKALNNYFLDPWVWWRYIDDIFLIWQHGEESLLKFIEYLNSLHPSIKFTYKYSRDSIEFLDVLVSRDGVGISTDLYVKDTDTHQYLQFSSCHTFHTKRGIPYGQALRLRRIISDDTILGNRCKELESWLVNRGYPRRMVTEQIERAKMQDRNSLLNFEKGQADKSQRPVLVLTYHPALSKKVHEIIRMFHPILLCDEEHRRFFSDLPLVAFRRTKSLSDILVRAAVPKTPDHSENGCRGCRGRGDCEVCDHITEATNFTSSSNGRNFDIRCGPLHCNSKHVVYLLECKTCGIQYVGSTITKFRIRCNNYKSQFRKYIERRDLGTLGRGKAVPQADLHAHFAQEGHNGLDDFSFKLIDTANTEEDLRKREMFWAFKLNTFLPNGLNDRDIVVEPQSQSLR